MQLTANRYIDTAVKNARVAVVTGLKVRKASAGVPWP